MSDLSEVFCELIVTADTHEQANCEIKTRVLGLQKFVEEHGGCFQIEHLGDGYGLDYKVEGNYKGKEISLGIEYKQFLNDFVPNHSTLEKRLSAAREHYDNIALVIEGEQLARTSRVIGDKNIWYTNPAVADGAADQMMNKQMFHDRMQIWMESGVLVRNIVKEDDFPDMFLYLVEYVTKDDDWYAKHKIDLPNTSFKNQYLNTIMSFGIEGIGLKTAQKIITLFPNLHWLATEHEDGIKDAIGKVTGKKLSDFLYNNELITSEWTRFGSKQQSQDFQQNASEIKPRQEISPQNIQTTKKDKKSLKSNPEQSKEVRDNTVTESNPELAYLDNHDTKCIEVPKGKFQNGGELFDVIDTKLKQDVLNFIKQYPKGIEYKKACDVFVVQGYDEEAFYLVTKSLMQDDGEIYEPKIGLLVATKPLQSPKSGGQSTKTETESVPSASLLSNTGQLEGQSAGRISQPKKEPTDNPASQTLAGAGSNLPDAQSNDEFKSNPRMKDIVEFIRRHPRKLDDVSTEFGLSKDYTFRALNELWHKKRIWFNKATLCFEFGTDKNPALVVAEKEFDVGV